MESYKYLIVGGGMTAAAAIKGIRELDEEGSIGLFSSDSHPPYDRPPLTKALWKGDPEDGIWRDAHGAQTHLGTNISSIDPAAKKGVTEDGTEFGYEKLLLATGVSPRRLDSQPDSILYYRTFDDYKRLREMTANGNRFLLIGGGFIGSELAAALTMNGKQAVMAFPDRGIGHNIFPEGLSLSLNDYYRGKGVEVLAGASVSKIEAQGNAYNIETTLGGFQVDHVIAGIGTVPNTGLAEKAGIAVENGILVDERLQTDHPDIYASGDVARFRDSVLDEWRRVEHEDNANTMGACAGRIMAGSGETYAHTPFFYSDLFDLGYEAVGNLSSKLEMVEDWKDPYKEGVVYYLHSGRVKGVLLWNTWDQVDNARALLAEMGPLTQADLIGRLPA